MRAGLRWGWRCIVVRRNAKRTCNPKYNGLSVGGRESCCLDQPDDTYWEMHAVLRKLN